MGLRRAGDRAVQGSARSKGMPLSSGLQLAAKETACLWVQGKQTSQISRGLKSGKGFWIFSQTTRKALKGSYKEKPWYHFGTLDRMQK